MSAKKKKVGEASTREFWRRHEIIQLRKLLVFVRNACDETQSTFGYLFTLDSPAEEIYE